MHNINHSYLLRNTLNHSPDTLVQIEDLYLSIEKESNDGFDASNENTDVIVVLDNGQKYIASFFTYSNISKLKLEHKKTGEYLSGKYFRVDNMVLIENCSKENIEEVVQYLIDEGDFEYVFRKIT